MKKYVFIYMFNILYNKLIIMVGVNIFRFYTLKSLPLVDIHENKKEPWKRFKRLNQ